MVAFLVVSAGSRARGLQSLAPGRKDFSGCSSRAQAQQAHGHSCFAAWTIFPGQGSNPCLPHWQADRFFTTEPPGKPSAILLTFCQHLLPGNWEHVSKVGEKPEEHKKLTTDKALPI